MRAILAAPRAAPQHSTIIESADGSRRHEVRAVKSYGISSRALENYQHIIRDFVKGKHGIYALYRRGDLYYVGLASNLRSRLNSHIRDRHRRLWDTFAIYLTIDNKYMKELESLVLRVTQPKGNRVKGGFAKSENLLRRFRNEIKRHLWSEMDIVTGRERARVKIRRGAKSRESLARPELAGVFGRSIALQGTYKQQTFRARVLKNGMIRFEKLRYKSLREAASIARGRPTNGWHFWKTKTRKGKWVSLRSLAR